MSREQLEENQIWVYAVALAIGAGLGLWRPAFGTSLEFLISPVIAILLYGMFTQIPFLQLREAFANRWFTAALLTVNFIVVPVLVWLMSLFLPDHPPLLIGVFLVLLTPCIDYVIVFTHLGRGNARLVLASTPLLLLAQMLLLPVYLWLFMGEQASQVMSAGPFLEAFLVLIVLPLGLALATEFWAKRRRSGGVFLDATAWLPVPLMATILLLVVASQLGRIEEHLTLVALAVPVYVCLHGHHAFLRPPDGVCISLRHAGGKSADLQCGDTKFVSGASSCSGFAGPLDSGVCRHCDPNAGGVGRRVDLHTSGAFGHFSGGKSLRRRG